MKLLYKIASVLRKIYWFIFRPKTTGVKCLIEYNEQYLFIRHAYASPQTNWNLPGGGIKNGESYEDAVKREVKEELGIDLMNITKIKQYTSNAEFKIDTVHLFHAKIEKQGLTVNSNEIVETRWFNKNDLPKNLSRSIKESLFL